MQLCRFLKGTVFCIPRLRFQIQEFDMVSIQDGCHTGGIFIAEGAKDIARYCSQAGIIWPFLTARLRQEEYCLESAH